jgi:hypothetical protein
MTTSRHFCRLVVWGDDKGRRNENKNDCSGDFFAFTVGAQQAKDISDGTVKTGLILDDD